jgi:hypothetical protein
MGGAGLQRRLPTGTLRTAVGHRVRPAIAHGGAMPARRSTAAIPTRFHGLCLAIPELCHIPRGQGVRAPSDRTSLADLRRRALAVAACVADRNGVRVRP